MTGCRWGELCNLRVKDFDGRAKLLTVKQEKTGRLKYVALTDEDIKFFSEVAVPKTASDLIFTKMDGSQWRKSDQQPRMAQAVESANVKERITFHGLCATRLDVGSLNRISPWRSSRNTSDIRIPGSRRSFTPTILLLTSRTRSVQTSLH